MEFELGQKQIEAAAAAIANERAMRRGSPPISNVLEVLMNFRDGKLYREVMEDAEAALQAVAALSPSTPTNAPQPTPPRRRTIAPA